MGEQRRIYKGFLSVHAEKAQTTSSAVLGELPIPHDAPLIALTRRRCSPSSTPTRSWCGALRRCPRTTARASVGLVFDKRTVLSDVLREPAAERAARKRRARGEGGPRSTPSLLPHSLLLLFAEVVGRDAHAAREAVLSGPAGVDEGGSAPGCR